MRLGRLEKKILLHLYFDVERATTMRINSSLREGSTLTFRAVRQLKQKELLRSVYKAIELTEEGRNEVQKLIAMKYSRLRYNTRAMFASEYRKAVKGSVWENLGTRKGYRN